MPKNNDTIDEERRQFLTRTTAAMGAIGIAGASIPFLTSMMPSATAKANAAPIKVDVSQLRPGEQRTVMWQGKPIWIIRRTQAMLADLANKEQLLRDPTSKIKQQPDYARNAYRSINPEFLVLVGVCTHLGCSPSYRPEKGTLSKNWLGGFFCSCHGSTFDLAGRVFKGVPAPINLEVPPYTFLSEHEILIGSNNADAVLT